MKDYLDDLLVWSIIIAVLTVVYFSVFKRNKNYMFTLGLLLLVGAVPAGAMLEGAVNFTHTRVWGIGYFLMILMGVSGLFIVNYSAHKKGGST